MAGGHGARSDFAHAATRRRARLCPPYGNFLPIIYVTKVDEAGRDKGRQASAQEGGIELTPQMIEAGERAFEDWRANGGLDDWSISDLVTGVFYSCLQAEDAQQSGE
jgi:hypothetical protein